jgi:hypothetical protein
MTTVSFTPALARFLAVPSTEVDAGTLGQAFATVFASRPALRSYLLDDQGALRRHVVVYINGSPARDRIGLTDPVGSRDHIYVFQALTGG